MNRPQEAVAALQQLTRAYGVYYAAVNGYNRAQFQLYRALGFPARNRSVTIRSASPRRGHLSAAQHGPVCQHVLSRPCP